MFKKHNQKHRNNYQNKRRFNNRPQSRPPKRTSTNRTPQSQLTESDVGITKFLNTTTEGFTGIIKARFSDFHVNEINLDGTTAKLTNQQVPKDFGTKTKVEISDLNTTPNPQLISQEIWNQIREMLLTKNEETTNVKEVAMDVTSLSKDDRKQVHEVLRSAFGTKIMSNTKGGDGDDEKKTMTIKRFNPSSKEGDRRFEWPKNVGEYVHFVVYKEALDTLEATLKLGEAIGINSANISYAGVKDKRAKTSQWFSVRKVEPWKLIVKTRHMNDVLKVGNIEFKDAPLDIGDLQGNRFRIALRNVEADDEIIEKSLDALRENGFINYYGLQRFGNNKDVPTYEIGMHLMLGNWKSACDVILKCLEADEPGLDLSRAKKVFAETRDAELALKEFNNYNRNKCVEYLLLKGLSKTQSNDYVNALESIPRNMRLLYIHAFQSLIWNRVASYRIEKFGTKPTEGDLVETDDENKVKALTSEECEKHTIYDIVLPLPGYDIVYPENLKDYYKEELEKYGLTLEMEKQSVKTYTLSGTYRKVLENVQDLSWKTLRYTEPNHTLIRSDFEELRKLPEPTSVEDGKYKALVLEFNLNRSSYATMVLREILKMETSTHVHSKLNNYHKIDEPTKVKCESSNEPNTPINDSNRFVDDPKYEDFKNLIYGTNTNKRKATSDDVSSQDNAVEPKISKNENVI